MTSSLVGSNLNGKTTGMFSLLICHHANVQQPADIWMPALVVPMVLTPYTDNLFGVLEHHVKWSLIPFNLNSNYVNINHSNIFRFLVHESPTYRYYLQPCCSFAPDELLVKTCPRSGYPGPPPSDPNGNPYARVICEIGHFRSTTSLWEMCEDWIRQPYVRYVIGIKFHDKKTTKNELGQLHRAMTVCHERAFFLSFFFFFYA